MIMDAVKLGYTIEQASPFELCLVKNGVAGKCWFHASFDYKMPTLDHPKIQRAIFDNEQFLDQTHFAGEKAK